ncbi:hypothetical protein T07_11153 [Trichinella nelsoni]|uniref:Uncharacterized protein n=1 Tax=Trichinella nelsoni TaxID=6336 RepID=A0A0V0RMZ1_9BILA|nr:hypothetical protein T07_8856 [Trichinella nelsoni]KRX16125.1 hypothetical protein T07_11153 [Trichinella nelsoni]
MDRFLRYYLYRIQKINKLSAPKCQRNEQHHVLRAKCPTARLWKCSKNEHNPHYFCCYHHNTTTSITESSFSETINKKDHFLFSNTSHFFLP